MPEQNDLPEMQSLIHPPPTLRVKTATMPPEYYEVEESRDHTNIKKGIVLRIRQTIKERTESPHSENEGWIPFTRRARMLLELDAIPMMHNLLAGFFSWLLLAGYMVLPGTFASMRSSQSVKDSANKAGKLVLKVVDNVPLLWIGGICCLIGAAGMFCLSWIWSGNYDWLLTRIIIPGVLHSTAGLITTLISVYTAHGGIWSVTAVVTAVVTGSSTIGMLALFFIYDTWLLQKVRRMHELAVEATELTRRNGYD
ncbi:hypothetical protein VE00_09471 [Pseudogymnoascus sp. WSF 3629]|nr:hypothetical protein VE00_09471 [Pseudogymnoascus sp. WSF 3629]